MCGRFTTTIDLEEIARYFKIAAVEGEYNLLYNAAPSCRIPVILGGVQRKLAFYRWGLIPSWAKDKGIGNKMINARAETLAQKPGFRQAYQHRRYLIPADGFYEWEKTGSGKTPYRIIMRDASPFGLAGLWEVWSPNGLDPVHSCTIITTQANSLLRPIHDRMPAILEPKDYDLWLDPLMRDPFVLDPLLKPYPSEQMEFYRVSPLVNSPLNNTPDVIRPAVN